MDDEEYTGCSTVVKVQLIGDRGVGKTSLMMSFINDQFFDVTSPHVFSTMHTTAYNGKVEPMFNLNTKSGETNGSLFLDDADIYRPMTDEIDMYNCALGSMSEEGSYCPRINTNHRCSYVDDVYIPGTATTTGIPCIIRDQPLLVGEFEQNRSNMNQTPAHVLDCPTSEMAMRDLVMDADVLCLVYRTDESTISAQTNQPICDYSSDSRANVLDKWIPFLLRCFIGCNQETCDDAIGASSTHDRFDRHVEKPVLIVGNTFEPVLISECDSLFLDGCSDDHAESPPDLPMFGLMDAYPWIRYWLRCSALTMYNVAEVFYCAQKSVIYPLVPICHPNLIRFMPAGLHAIQHIFAILDERQTGQISDHALVMLQQEVLRSQYRLTCPSGNSAMTRFNAVDPLLTQISSSQSFKWDLMLPTARDFLNIHRLLTTTTTTIKNGAEAREFTSFNSRIDHRVGYE